VGGERAVRLSERSGTRDRGGGGGCRCSAAILFLMEWGDVCVWAFGSGRGDRCRWRISGGGVCGESAGGGTPSCRELILEMDESKKVAVQEGLKFLAVSKVHFAGYIRSERKWDVFDAPR